MARKGVEKRVAKLPVFVNRAWAVSFTARSSHAVAYKNAVAEILRPSAFQALCHPESTYLEKAPTAQLMRIDAADRLFSLPLTRITSVPECAVSSVGFLWGSAAVSLSCGVLWGSPKS